MNLGIEGIKSKLSNFFSVTPQIEALYLFGSQAEGTANSASDIDIALLLSFGKDRSYYQEQYLNLLAELMKNLNRDDVELVILNTCTSSELKYNIIHDGIALFSRYDRLIEYELRAEHEYHDHMSSLRRSGLTKG